MDTGRTERTTWAISTYDVWGNAEDGYEVNDVYRQHSEYEIDADIHQYNVGTPQQFESAHPSDDQIREALDIKPDVPIRTDGDDLNIIVELAEDYGEDAAGYPLGELHCTSHQSLSPIRK